MFDLFDAKINFDVIKDIAELGDLKLDDVIENFGGYQIYVDDMYVDLCSLNWCEFKTKNSDSLIGPLSTSNLDKDLAESDRASNLEVLQKIGRANVQGFFSIDCFDKEYLYLAYSDVLGPDGQVTVPADVSSQLQKVKDDNLGTIVFVLEKNRFSYSDLYLDYSDAQFVASYVYGVLNYIDKLQSKIVNRAKVISDSLRDKENLPNLHESNLKVPVQHNIRAGKSTLSSIVGALVLELTNYNSSLAKGDGEPNYSAIAELVTQHLGDEVGGGIDVQTIQKALSESVKNVMP